MKINIEATKQSISELDSLTSTLGEYMLQQCASVGDIMNNMNIPSLESLMTKLNDELYENYKIMINSIYIVNQFLLNQISNYAALSEEAKERVEGIISKISASLNSCNSNFDFGGANTVSQYTGYSFDK